MRCDALHFITSGEAKTKHSMREKFRVAGLRSKAEEMCNDLRAGLQIKDIAKRLHVSVSFIHTVITEHLSPLDWQLVRIDSAIARLQLEKLSIERQLANGKLKTKVGP